MPRLSNTVPKYRKHRRSGQAIVTLAGRDHYLGQHGTRVSRLEYDRLITEWLASGRLPSFGSSQGELSVAELLVAFLRHAKINYGEGLKSEFFHYRRLARPMKELYASLPVADFGPLQFRAVRERIIQDGCSRPFINRSMSRIARIFRWGVGQGLVAVAVPQALAMVDGLRRGKSAAPETSPVRPIDDGIVEQTIEQISPVVGVMVRLQRLSGCRPSEICKLRPRDVDRTEEIWRYELEEHKTAHHGRNRTIYFGPNAQAILLRFLVRDENSFCFSPRESERERLAQRTADRKTPLNEGNVVGSNRIKRPSKRGQSL